MPRKDYRAWANTPAGKAARQRAHARYVQQRKDMQCPEPAWNVAPLIQVINHWKSQ